METSDTKDFIVDVNYEINDTNDVPLDLEWMSYRSMVKYAMSIGLPGNFKVSVLSFVNNNESLKYENSIMCVKRND